MRGLLLVPLTIAAGFVLVGCGGDEAPAPDDVAGLGDAASALTPPEPPVLTPCPEGWEEVAAEGPESVATCEPWPGGSDERCQGAMAHFLGESGCRDIGPACPDGDWAEDIPEDAAVLYVRLGGEGGDGSREAPFGSIASALDSAAPGAAVALAKGTYDEALLVEADVALWGACAAETIVAPSTPDEGEPAISVDGAELALRNLQVSGARPGLMATGGAALHLDDVLLSGLLQVAIGLEGDAELSADGLVVRGTHYEGEEPAASLMVGEGALARVDDSVFIDNEGFVVWAMPGSDVALDGVAIRDTHLGGVHRVPAVFEEGEDDAIPMVNAIAAEDAVLTVTESLVECSQGTAGILFGAEMYAELSRSVVRGDGSWVSCPSFPPGAHVSMGLNAAGGAHATFDRMLFAGNRGVAVMVTQSRNAILRDVVIRDTLGIPRDALGASFDPLDGMGMGLMLFYEASAEVERTLIERTTGVAIVVLETFRIVIGPFFLIPTGSQQQAQEATVNLAGTDVAIRHTTDRPCYPVPCGNPEDAFGIGLVAAEDGVVDLLRFAVSDNVLVGLQLAGGAMRLEEGLVARNEIGVNLQTPNLDFEALTERVVFLDNGRNLDSENLPVPLLGAFQPDDGGDDAGGDPDAGEPDLLDRDAGPGRDDPGDDVNVEPTERDPVEERLLDLGAQCQSICEGKNAECTDTRFDCTRHCDTRTRELTSAIWRLVEVPAQNTCLDSCDRLLGCSAHLACGEYEDYLNGAGGDGPCADMLEALETSCQL